MIIAKSRLRLVKTLAAAGFMAFLASCGSDANLNTETVTYTPEERPLGVIAGSGGEFSPGATVTLEGRLVGTVSDETVRWSQTSGDPVDVDDWTQPTLTFTAPMVEGIAAFSFQIAALDASGHVIETDEGEPMVDEVEILVYDPEALLVYEVEDDSVAQLNSVTLVSEGGEGYITGASGGAHTADITPGATVAFTLDIGADEAGFYTLYARFAIPSDYGGKVGQVAVNGVPTDVDISATGNWDDYRVGTIKLDEGENIIEVGGGWNYYRVDNISMIGAPAPAGPLPVTAELVNEDASATALNLMEFLTSHYGSATLSGQTEFPTRGSGANFELFEFDKVVAATGDDAPAIVAFDLMDFSASRVANGSDPYGLSEDMIAAHQELNVILSALWHWNAPSGLHDTEDQPWYRGFYTEATSFDLATALADTSSEQYQELIADIDTIAAELKKFADADIPILWRPLHEAEGGWFWWGAAGPDALKDLWVLMYDRMKDHHGLNNLIWVYTHAGDLSTDWYPGDGYVDIVAYDGYDGNNVDNPFAGQYKTLKDRHDGKKLVAMGETGTIPNVELMHENNAWWSFFITWNSSGEDYGPDNLDSAIIDANYAFDGVINLAEVPGGRAKVEAGIYDDFEPDVEGWGAQVNWSNVPGTSVGTGWATSGLNALTLSRDLSTDTDPTSVVLQSYPADGIDVSEVDTITVDTAAADAGVNTTVYLFVKHGDDWTEVATDPVAADGATLELDVAGIDWLAGLGVVFQNFDGTSSNAKFYLDNVKADDTVLYDFEPDASGWANQINWANVSGTTTSTDWANSGSRSLALYQDLVALGESENIVFQTYPEGGIDVTDKSMVTIQAYAEGAGNAVDAHIFYKAPNGVESWPSAVAVTESGVELAIDVSDVDTLNGLGVLFNGVDPSADARFFIDTVKVDGEILYDFEGAGNWEFQVNWTPAPGIHLSSEWTADGSVSLAGVTQLEEGDDNVILQTYPEGGILLGDVNTIRVKASAVDAGDAVQVKLWAKGKNDEWLDDNDTSVPVTEAGVELTVDISTVDELQGFGLQFIGPDNSSTESKYFLDQVEFLE